MNRFSFLLAFNGFVIISLFVYYFFPKEWKETWWRKLILIAYHVIGVLSLELTFLMYKDIPYHWLAHLSVVISTFYYVPIMIMGIFFAIGAAIRFIYRLFMKKHPDRSLSWKVPGAPHRAVLTASLAYLLTGVGFFNADHLYLTEYDVASASMNGKEPLDIVLIADTHAGSGNWDSLYPELSELVKQADPDVILIGGDIFDETTGRSDMKMLGEVLRGFEAPLGVYYTLGNHDDPESEILRRAIDETGAVSLEDRGVRLRDDILLLGRKDDGQVRMTAEEILSAADGDDTVLVLEHRPTEFQKLADLGTDLVMSGHTHGFNIPMIAAVYWKANVVYGMRQYNDMTAVVTSGVSGWGFHYKCPAKNEVVLIHLHGN